MTEFDNNCFIASCSGDLKISLKDCLHIVFLARYLAHFFTAFFIAFLASTGTNGGMKNATKNTRNGLGTHSVRKTLHH